MSKMNIVFITIILLSLLLSLIPYLLPIPSHVTDAFTFRLDITILVFLALLRIGVGILFLLGLKSFKTAFKHAYYLICAGAITYGVFSLPYPISRYMNEWNSWYTLFASDIPTTIGFIMLYIGVYKFAKLMNTRNFYMAYKKFLPILIVIMTLLWILPHRPNPDTVELEFDLIQSAYAIEVFLSVLAVGLVLEIRKAANATYSRALGWFLFAVLFDGLAGAYYMSYNYLRFPSWLPEETLAILYIICGCIFLIAGYSFNTMKAATEISGNQTKENATIDIVVYTANLASKLQDINSFLEPMRFITAKLEKGQQPSAEQEKELVKVYQDIEEYLITKEPLRNYTRESLQAQLLARFNRIPS